MAFADAQNPGLGDRLCVLLKDQSMLPRELARGTVTSAAATQHYTALSIEYTEFLAFDRHPPQVPLAVPDANGQRHLVDIAIPPRPARETELEVPAGLRPLLVVDAVLPNRLTYGVLEDRFLRTYVANYPVDSKWRKRDYFTGSPAYTARLALLRALFWMLVVRPFQQVIRNNRALFPGIDPDGLTPVAVAGVAGGDADRNVNLPAPEAPRGRGGGDGGGEDPLARLNPTGRMAGGRGGGNPHQAQTFAAVFGDKANLAVVAEVIYAEENWPLTEVERLFAAPTGPIHRAMEARPQIFAAVLFAVFEEHFAGHEDVFVQNARTHERGSAICVFLKDRGLLPVLYAGVTAAAATMQYNRLSTAWEDYLDGTLLPDNLGVTLAAIRRHIPTNLEALVDVPPVMRTFFLTREQPQKQPRQRYGRLRDGLFLGTYVEHYPLDNRRRTEHYFANSAENKAREGLVKTLFWLLVVRPFQEVVAQVPHLFPIQAGELTPRDEDESSGSSDSSSSDDDSSSSSSSDENDDDDDDLRGGNGRDRRGGSGGGGGGGGGGRGGGGRGNPPPRNPPPRRNPPGNRQPAPAQPSSARTSRPQRGTCSAAAKPPPSRAQTLRRKGPASKHPAPEDDEDEDDEEEDDDFEPHVPPAKKPRRRDQPPKGPDGGAGAGMVF